MAAGINYLYDVDFTLQGAGPDDGNVTRTPVGQPVTFKVDTLRIRRGRDMEDHSAGQDEMPFMRTRKKARGIDISAKLEKADAIAAILSANDIVLFSCTSLDGSFDISDGVAIVGEVEAEFGAPSNKTFALAPYGSEWS